MVTILNALTTEIRVAVCDIDSNDKQSISFTSPKSLAKQDIREQPGTPRLFQTLWDAPSQMDGGHTEKTWDVPGTITIGYPSTADWNATRAADVSEIFDALNQTDSSVTGCEFRHVPQGVDPETEVAEKEWTWVVIPLRAVVTTT